MYKVRFLVVLVLLLLFASAVLAQTTFAEKKQNKEELQQLVDLLIEDYNSGVELTSEQLEILENSGFFHERPENINRTDELDEIFFLETFDYADVNDMVTNGGWTVVDGGVVGPVAPWHTWNIQTTHRGSEHVLDDTSPFAVVDSDRAGSYDMDESLITPTIDASSYGDMVLTFDYAYKGYSAPNEQGDVDYSIDDGATWTNLVVFTTPRTQVMQEYPHTIVLPEETDYCSTLKIRFHYYGANYDYWWAIDNVGIDGIPEVGNIAGNVYDEETMVGLPDVTVTLENNNTTTTDVNGYYEFVGINTGTHAVTFSKIGYNTETFEDVFVSVDQTTTVNAYLIQALYDLSGTVTSVGNENVPLESVTVTLLELALETTTDVNGYYFFDDALAGNYTLQLQPDNANITPWCHDYQIDINLNQDTVLDLTLEEILPPYALGVNQLSETSVNFFWTPPENHNLTALAELNRTIDQMQQADQRIRREGTPEELAKHATFTRELNILKSNRDQMLATLDTDDLFTNFIGYRIYINDVLQPELYTSTSITIGDLNTSYVYTFNVAADYGYGDVFLIPAEESVSIRPLPTTESYWTYEETDYVWIEIDPNSGGLGIPVPNWGDDENSGWLEWGTGQTFELYGVEETGFHICSNGWLSFDRGSTGNTAIRPRIPSASSPNLMLALLGIDTDTGDRDCGNWYQVDPDNDQVIVQYHNRYYSNSDPLYIHEAIINTAENEIILSYQTAGPNAEWHGHSPVETGIENATGSEGVVIQNSIIDNYTSFRIFQTDPIGEWAAFRGVVTDLQTSDPVDGFSIRAVSTIDGSDFLAAGDGNGNYTLLVDRALAPYDIYCSREGYHQLISNNHDLNPDEFHTEVDLQLNPLGTINGNVFNLELPETQLDLASVQIENLSTGQIWDLLTDADGYFEVTNSFHVYHNYSITVSRDGYLTGGVANFTFEEEQHEINLQIGLDPLGTIYGVTSDIDGNPLEDVLVHLSSFDNSQNITLFTNELGEFNFIRLLDREQIYSLYCEAEGYLETEPVNLTFEPDNSMIGPIDLTLIALDNSTPPSIFSAENYYDHGFDLTVLPPGLDHRLDKIRYDDGIVSSAIDRGLIGMDGAVAIKIDPGYESILLSGGFRLPVAGDNIGEPEPWPDGVHDPVRISVYGCASSGLPDPNNVLYVSEPILNDDEHPWAWIDAGVLLSAEGGWISIQNIEGATAYCVDALTDYQGSSAAYVAGTGWIYNDFGGDLIAEVNIASQAEIDNIITAINLNSNYEEYQNSVKIKFDTAPGHRYSFGKSYGQPAGATPSLANPVSELLQLTNISDELDEVTGYNYYISFDDIDFALYNETPIAEDFYFLEVGSEYENTDIYFQVSAILDVEGEPFETLPTESQLIQYSMTPNSVVNLQGSTLETYVEMNWEAPLFNEDGSDLTDLSGYNIYRSGTLIANIEDVSILTFSETIPEEVINNTNGLIYYEVVAVDDNANESIPHIYEAGLFGESTFQEGFEDLEVISFLPLPPGSNFNNAVVTATELWQQGVPTSGPGVAYTGIHAMGTNLAGNYSNDQLKVMVSEPIEMLGPNAAFTYYHYYAYETGIDGYSVWASLDNGETWEHLTPFGGYPRATSAFRNYGLADGGYSGSITGWQPVTVSLGEYYNEEQRELVRLAFVHATDVSVTNAGVYIDEMEFYNAAPGWGYPLAPYPFNLISPEDGSSIPEDLVTVSWEESYDPNPNENLIYTVEWSSDPDFEPLYSTTTTETSFTITDFANPPTDNIIQSNGLRVEKVGKSKQMTSGKSKQSILQQRAASVGLDELPDNSVVYWRVRVEDNSGHVVWANGNSDGWLFATDIPTPPAPFHLLTPTDTEILEELEATLSWEEAIDPDPIVDTNYNVWLDTQEDLSTAVLVAENLAETSVYIGELDDDMTYYWTVHATDNNTDGTWAEDIFSFTTNFDDYPGDFELLLPEDGAVIENQEVALTCSESENLDPGDEISYEFQVSLDPEFVDYESFQSTAASMVLGNPADDMVNYWRVKAIDSGGQETWAEPGMNGWSFTYLEPDAPSTFSLLEPEDETVIQSESTVLSWEESIDVDLEDFIIYHVFISETEDFTENVVELLTEDTSLEVHALTENTVFWWKVLAQDTNTDGTWSNETWSFIISTPEPPEAFGLATPGNGQEIEEDEVTVSWTRSSDPDPGDEVIYVVEWSTDTDFETYYTSTTADTFYLITDLANTILGLCRENGPYQSLENSEDVKANKAPTAEGSLSISSSGGNELDELPDDTVIYWRVKAVDTFDLFTYGIPGEAGWSFAVNMPEPPEPFDLVSPEDGITFDTLSWVFEWEETIDPDPGDEVGYLLAISLVESFDDSMVAYYNANENTSFRVPYMADDTDYWWRVMAYDTNTEGRLSESVRTFHTAMPEPPFDFEVLSGDMMYTGVDDTVNVSLSWNRTWDPDPDADELYSVYVANNEAMNNPVLLGDNIVPEGTDSLYTWETEVSLLDLPGVEGDVFYMTVLAQDNNTEGTWASNVVNTLLTIIIENNWDGTPIEYEFTSVYPNPFNPLLTAVVALPAPGDLKVVVYNVMGQQVALLTDQQHREGYHQFMFNAASLSSGVYFVHAQVPGKLNQIRKVVLMK